MKSVLKSVLRRALRNGGSTLKGVVEAGGFVGVGAALDMVDKIDPNTQLVFFAIAAWRFVYGLLSEDKQAKSK